MKAHEYDVFCEAERYIRAHMQEPLQVADIAGAIHVSESRLQRSFRACVQVSVHEYVLRLKLETAMGQLRRGEQVGAVARSVGFSNGNHFSHCFKRRYGITPSEAKSNFAAEDQ